MHSIHIVGAGLGGLTLANALRQSGRPYTITVTERDARPESRPQGYALTLHRGGALWALERLGLYKDIARVSYASTSLPDIFLP